jgi:hypothetical protein
MEHHFLCIFHIIYNLTNYYLPFSRQLLSPSAATSCLLFLLRLYLCQLWLLLWVITAKKLCHVGVVANHHHGKDSPGYLGKPSETPEDEHGCQYQSCDTEARYVAATEIAEEVAHHSAAVAGEYTTEEV